MLPRSFSAVTHAVGRGPMSLEECLRRVRTCGFDGIFLLTWPDGPAVRSGVEVESYLPNVLESDAEELLRRIAAAGLELTALYAPVRPDVSSDDAADATERRLDAYRGCALRLGCPALCVPAPRAEAPLLPVERKREEILRFARVLDAVAGRCPGGVPSVSVDLHYHSLVESVDDCRVLLEAMAEPNAGVLLNIGHLTTGRQEGWRLVEEYPDRLPLVAWKDHSLADDRPHPVYSVELGTGNSRFERYLHAFERANTPARHLVNVEHAPPGEEVAALTRSLQYLRNLWRRGSKALETADERG